MAHQGEALVVLGRGLFGDDALRSGKMTHPIVIRWLKHVLHFVRLDWIQNRNEPYRRIDRIRYMVYTMCRGT